MSPLAWALVAGTIRASVELSDRTEARVRNDDFNKPVVDVETAPQVTLALRAPRTTFSVAYTPRFTMLGSSQFGPQSLIFNALRVGATWHDRITSLTFNHDVSIGRQSFAGLAPQPSSSGDPGRPEVVPTSGILNYGYSNLGLTVQVAPSPRYGLTLIAQHSLNGGLDQDSRRTMPFQHGPLASLGFTYHFSRVDHLSATASFSRTWLFAELQRSGRGLISDTLAGVGRPITSTMDMDDLIAQSTGSWRHVFNRATEATLTAGVGWAKALHDGIVVRTAVHPVAEASLLHHVPSGRFDVRLDVRFSPMVDRWTGEVDERIDYLGWLQWNATRALSVRAYVIASQPLPPVHLDTALYMIDNLSLVYQFNRFFQMEGGARSLWAHWLPGDMQPPGGPASAQLIAPFTWVSFLAVTVSAPSLKF